MSAVVIGSSPLRMRTAFSFSSLRKTAFARAVWETALLHTSIFSRAPFRHGDSFTIAEVLVCAVVEDFPDDGFFSETGLEGVCPHHVREGEVAVAGEHEGVFFHEFSEADFTGGERVEDGGGLLDAGEEVVGKEGVCLGSLHAAYEFGVGHELGSFEGARPVDEVKPRDELAVSLRSHF